MKAYMLSAVVGANGVGRPATYRMYGLDTSETLTAQNELPAASSANPFAPE